MVAKKGKRSAKSVKSLKAKSLSAKQAKGVKGGIIITGGQPIQDWRTPQLQNPPDGDFGIKR